MCQVEPADLKSFLRTGEELGYEGLLETAEEETPNDGVRALSQEVAQEIQSHEEEKEGASTNNLALEVIQDSFQPHLMTTQIKKQLTQRLKMAILMQIILMYFILMHRLSLVSRCHLEGLLIGPWRRHLQLATKPLMIKKHYWKLNVFVQHA